MSTGIQYGVEEGAMDCCGYEGNQAPEANMEGVVGAMDCCFAVGEPSTRGNQAPVGEGTD